LVDNNSENKQQDIHWYEVNVLLQQDVCINSGSSRPIK